MVGKPEENPGKYSGEEEQETQCSECYHSCGGNRGSLDRSVSVLMSSGHPHSSLPGLMSRGDSNNDGAQDELCSLISSTTDLFTSLDVTESVTDLCVSESSQQTSTITQSSNNKTSLSTSRTGDVTDDGDKSSVNCDQNSRQILSARELHNQHIVKICTDV